MSKIKKFTSKAKQKLIFHGVLAVCLILALTGVAVIAAKQLNFPISLISKAAGSQTVFFNTSKIDLTGEKTIQVYAGSKSQSIGFVKVKITFNPEKIRITKPIVTSTKLTNKPQEMIFTDLLPVCAPTDRCILKTKPEDANKTGVIILALGFDPKVAPPKDVFEVAQITLAPVRKNQKTTTEMRVTIGESQLINIDAVTIPISSDPLTVNLP